MINKTYTAQELEQPVMYFLIWDSEANATKCGYAWDWEAFYHDWGLERKPHWEIEEKRIISLEQAFSFNKGLLGYFGEHIRTHTAMNDENVYCSVCSYMLSKIAQ